MKTSFYLMALLMFSFNASAESKFYTGFWQYTIEIKVPGMPQSELKKVQKCIREINDVINLFKPDPTCFVNHVQVTDSQLSWKLYCKTTGGTYEGEAQLAGNERTLNGSIAMQTAIPGMKNIMSTTYVITGANQGVCQ